jgi:hypothetical protein
MPKTVGGDVLEFRQSIRQRCSPRTTNDRMAKDKSAAHVCSIDVTSVEVSDTLSMRGALRLDKSLPTLRPF